MVDNNQMDIEMDIEEEVSCCVCFVDQNVSLKDIVSLTDIQSLTETNAIKLDTIIKSSCESHYICIECLRRIVNDYTNHPINENNSHVYCPYPFDDCLTPAGTKNVFDHQSILKILTIEEGRNFIEHADRFAFPGFTMINCPCIYYGEDNTICNYPVLIENELITSANIGDLIVHCHQNEKCCKYFCYHCRQEMSRYQSNCRMCKLTSENENPNIFNRYLTKDILFENILYDDIDSDDNISTNGQQHIFDETDYLFLNKEITIDIALKHIKNIIENNVHCICPICKINLYKTEKCNGMKHHNIERCYACARIGDRISGLPNSHWNSDGYNGCYRFDYDRFVTRYVPEYECNDSCHNHDIGDCTKIEHELGIKKLNKIRQKAIIYNFIKSLLPNIRYIVLNTLYELYVNIPTAYELLPYKQTFVFLEMFKDVRLDYYEDIIYEHIYTLPPINIPEFIDKSFIIDGNIYMNQYYIQPPIQQIPYTPPPLPDTPPLPQTPPLTQTPPPDIIIPEILLPEIVLPEIPPRRLLPVPRRPPPPPRRRIQRRLPPIHIIDEIEEIIQQVLVDETEPLLGDIGQDITDLLTTYTRLNDEINNEINNLNIPTNLIDNTDNNDDTDNSVRVYTLTSDSDTESDI